MRAFHILPPHNNFRQEVIIITFYRQEIKVQEAKITYPHLTQTVRGKLGFEAKSSDSKAYSLSTKLLVSTFSFTTQKQNFQEWPS